MIKIRLAPAGFLVALRVLAVCSWRLSLFQIKDERPILAIDIGGTKLEVGVVTTKGEILERLRRPTGRTESRTLFEVLCEMLDCFRPFDQFQAVGVGCGGPMSNNGELVSPLNISDWNDFALKGELVSFTGLPTSIDNDAKALALAEGWKGAAVGHKNYLAMVVSTGVGAGIVLDGRLLDGAAGNAGHIGHVVVEPKGFALAGHVPGVLEAEASGTGIEARLGMSAIDAPESEKVRAGTLVGRAVGSVANLLDLKLALVAGSVALGFGEVFFSAAQAEVDRICQLDYSRGTLIQPAGCGSDGPLVGAAAVALVAA